MDTSYVIAELTRRKLNHCVEGNFKYLFQGVGEEDRSIHHLQRSKKSLKNHLEDDSYKGLKTRIHHPDEQYFRKK